MYVCSCGMRSYLKTDGSRSIFAQSKYLHLDENDLALGVCIPSVRIVVKIRRKVILNQQLNRNTTA